MRSNVPPAEASRKDRRASAPFWVSTTYFAEGFPYGLVNNVVEILFQQLGASLKVIGLTSLFHLPWNLKFLWGPFVDQYETKRRWLVWVEIALTINLLAFALLVGGAERITGLIVAAIVFLAFLSATHDIAIDGFYLEALDEKEQSTYVGFRATFYRFATISLSGPLLWLIGKSSWQIGLLSVFGVMAALATYHFFLLPDPEKRQAPLSELGRQLLRPRLLRWGSLVAVVILVEREFGPLGWLGRKIGSLPVVGKFSIAEWAALALLALLVLTVWLGKRGRKGHSDGGSTYLRSFTSFMDQDRALVILVFVVLFRTGESFLAKMRWPFLARDMHMSLESYAFVNGTLGVIASFVATLLGGWLIGKLGLRRCIWPFVIAQNFLNLLYMWLAAAGSVSELTVGLVIAVEHAGSGLGTAVFMVYLMRCCDPGHKAGHMAIVTALMSVSFTLAGVMSGFLAESLGFAIYFGLTFVATIPAMLVIPWLPYLDHGRAYSAPVAAG